MPSVGFPTTVVSRVTGTVAVVCSLLGVLYNARSLTVALTGGFDELVAMKNMSWFYPAFYAMSAICIGFYVALAWCGFQFLRLRTNATWPFCVLMLVEVAYFFTIGTLAVHAPDLGVAGALGVANGGLMAQYFILLPLWGPICAIWTRRRMVLHATT